MMARMRGNLECMVAIKEMKVPYTKRTVQFQFSSNKVSYSRADTPEQH